MPFRDGWRHRRPVQTWSTGDVRSAGTTPCSLCLRARMLSHSCLFVEHAALCAQIWRLITHFLYLGGLGFPFIMNSFYLYSYSSQVENQLFDRRPGDYTYTLFVGAMLLNVLALVLGIPTMGLGLVMVIIYLWAQRNTGQPTAIFGVSFDARYLPWALCVLTVLLGGSPMIQLCGIAAGHTIYFLEDLYPAMNGGVYYMTTPELWYSLVPQQRMPAPGRRAEMPAAGVPPVPRGHNWGGGRPLGAQGGR